MEYISKSQKKREAESLQDLGEKLLNLSLDQIDELDLPAELHEAVKFAGTLKSHGARRRQLQRIGSIMRNIDPQPIRDAIEIIEQGNRHKALEFKRIEKWRDDLISGNRILIDEILEQHPATDRQKLTQLVRNSIKEKDQNKPPKASRNLFRYLRNVVSFARE